MWLPALLHSVALLIALCVQTMSSPLASMWLPFFIGGCGVLLRKGYSSGSLVWQVCLLWLIAVASACFILVPVSGSSGFFFAISVMPLLALCLHKEDIKPYIICFGAVLGIYAVGLMVQQTMHVHYTNFNFDGHGGRSWPLLDPNNAAALLNAGVVLSFGMVLKDKRWLMPLGFFLVALLITKSRAGCFAAVIACSVLAIHRYGHKVLFMEAAALAVAEIAACFWRPEWLFTAIDSMLARLPIWEAAFRLLTIRPLLGLGIGTFSTYYSQVRTETQSGGWFAHNDILQFAIEMGWPIAAIFCCLAIAVVIKTTKNNIIPACYMLAVFLQGMVEFEFYTIPANILMGVALAWHSLNFELTMSRPKSIMYKKYDPKIHSL